MKTILITGGARSGKSRYAQELATYHGGRLLFVATAEAGDEDMRQRIAAHKRSRPAEWQTLEAAADIGSQIEQHIDTADIVLVDCITLLVNNVFNRYGGLTDEQVDVGWLEEKVTAEINQLIACIDRLKVDFIIVTNEVGLGLVPANRVGRVYRDLLGKANQMLAARADEVYLMVSGLPLCVKNTPSTGQKR